MASPSRCARGPRHRGSALRAHRFPSSGAGRMKPAAQFSLRPSFLRSYVDLFSLRRIILFENLLQPADEPVVFFRRADTDTKAIIQHRIVADVAYQDVASQQLCENRLGLDARSHHDEICL